MGFANFYYANAKNQIWLLSHDGALMNQFDVINVFFFFYIGFNLMLVLERRQLSAFQLLQYALLRAGKIALIGMILGIYLFFIYGFKPILWLRSFLVVLAVSMVVTSVFIFLFKKNLYLWAGVTGLALVALFVLQLKLPAPYRFLTPYYLLCSFVGCILALMRNSQKYSLISLATATAFVATGLLAWQFYEAPSRKLMSTAYIHLSLAVVIALNLVFLKFYKGSESGWLKWIERVGQQPLKFWVFQSLLIALFVLLVSFFTYWQNSQLDFFWVYPYQARLLKSAPLAIVVCVAGSLLTAFLVEKLPRFRVLH